MRFLRGRGGLLMPVAAFQGVYSPPAIQFIASSTSETQSLDPSAAQVDDAMIHGAFRTADNTAIGFPGGDYKQPAVGGLIVQVTISGTSVYGLADYKISDEAGTETFTGTLFTGGTTQILGIYRNVDKITPFLALKMFNGSGNPITIPALSHNDANATVLMMLRTASNVTVTTGPSGFNSRSAANRRLFFDKALLANYAGESFSADTAPGTWVGWVGALKRA